VRLPGFAKLALLLTARCIAKPRSVERPFRRYIVAHLLAKVVHAREKLSHQHHPKIEATLSELQLFFMPFDGANEPEAEEFGAKRPPKVTSKALIRRVKVERSRKQSRKQVVA